MPGSCACSQEPITWRVKLSPSPPRDRAYSKTSLFIDRSFRLLFFLKNESSNDCARIYVSNMIFERKKTSSHLFFPLLKYPTPFWLAGPLWKSEFAGNSI